MKHIALFLTSLAFAPPICSAENALVTSHPTLSLEGAKIVASAAVAFAREQHAPGGAIAVVDASGTLLYLERLDGTFLNASSISIGKARTAALFGKPTRQFEEAINNGRVAMLDVADVAPFTPLQGGIPITVGGHTVGAIGVSGAASAKQDEEIALAGAAAFARSSTREVTFVPKRDVEVAFAKDTTLIEETGWRINASRRDRAGEAEVHLEETDVFHVLEGRATFVTGGEIVDPRNVSPTEIRGSALRGGRERQLAQGDVISIPRGTPHWFKEVDGPFIYYVVKARL